MTHYLHIFLPNLEASLAGGWFRNIQLMFQTHIKWTLISTKLCKSICRYEQHQIHYKQLSSNGVRGTKYQNVKYTEFVCSIINTVHLVYLIFRLIPYSHSNFKSILLYLLYSIVYIHKKLKYIGFSNLKFVLLKIKMFTKLV